MLTSLFRLFLYFPSFLEFNECALAFNQKLVKELKKKCFFGDSQSSNTVTWKEVQSTLGLQLGRPGCPVPDACGCLALHAVPLSSSLQSALPQAIHADCPIVSIQNLGGHDLTLLKGLGVRPRPGVGL